MYRYVGNSNLEKLNLIFSYENILYFWQLLSRLWSGNQVNSSKQSEQQLAGRLQQRFKGVCNTLFSYWIQ